MSMLWIHQSDAVAVHADSAGRTRRGGSGSDSSSRTSPGSCARCWWIRIWTACTWPPAAWGWVSRKQRRGTPRPWGSHHDRGQETPRSQPAAPFATASRTAQEARNKKQNTKQKQKQNRTGQDRTGQDRTGKRWANQTAQKQKQKQRREKIKQWGPKCNYAAAYTSRAMSETIRISQVCCRPALLCLSVCLAWFVGLKEGVCCCAMSCE